VEGPGLPAATTSGAYRPIAYEPSPLWRSLYDRFFSHIAVDEGWADAVRRASARGHVVYIGRAQSFLDFLGLDYLVKKHALPLIKLTNDLGMSVLEPFGRGSRRLRRAAPIPEESALADTIAAGASALLFLRRPPSVSGSLTGSLTSSLTSAKEGRAGAALDVDLVRTLVELQRKTEKPIILLPQTLVWTKRTPNKQPTLVDVLFGPSDWPGRVRTSLQFLFNYRNAIHRGGEPFDLLAFLAENQDLTDAQAADAVRYALLRRMERERTIILGPARKSGGRLKDELLRSPRLRRHMQLAAKDGPKPLAAIEARDASRARSPRRGARHERRRPHGPRAARGVGPHLRRPSSWTRRAWRACARPRDTARSCSCPRTRATSTTSSSRACSTSVAWRLR
jgi:glycerol-3-phosphate O-acyltransferase